MPRAKEYSTTGKGFLVATFYKQTEAVRDFTFYLKDKIDKESYEKACKLKDIFLKDLEEDWDELMKRIKRNEDLEEDDTI